MKRLIVLVALALTACGSEQRVAEPTIRAATQVCANNGGVDSIRRAYAQGESERCGHKCTRATGRFLYSANVKCNNGANFYLNFTE